MKFLGQGFQKLEHEHDRDRHIHITDRCDGTSLRREKENRAKTSLNSCVCGFQNTPLERTNATDGFDVVGITAQAQVIPTNIRIVPYQSDKRSVVGLYETIKLE